MAHLRKCPGWLDVLINYVNVIVDKESSCRLPHDIDIMMYDGKLDLSVKPNALLYSLSDSSVAGPIFTGLML